MSEGSYGLTMKIHSRTKGESAVANAAYRSGSKLRDVYYGVDRDFRRKAGVLETGIMGSAVPAGWRNHDGSINREQFWNAVELAESRKDAQLSREFILTLDKSLTPAQRHELVRSWVDTELVSRGMVADYALHDQKRVLVRDAHGHIVRDAMGKRIKQWNGNYHAHVSVALREVSGEGLSRLKNRDWNQREFLESMHRSWERHQNDYFARHQLYLVVSSKSNIERGIDQIPQVKKGPQITRLLRSEDQSEFVRGQVLLADKQALYDELWKEKKRLWELNRQETKAIEQQIEVVRAQLTMQGPFPRAMPGIDRPHAPEKGTAVPAPLDKETTWKAFAKAPKDFATTAPLAQIKYVAQRFTNNGDYFYANHVTTPLNQWIEEQEKSVEPARNTWRQLQPGCDAALGRLNDWKREHPQPSETSFFYNRWAKKHDAVLSETEWETLDLYAKAQKKIVDHEKSFANATAERELRLKRGHDITLQPYKDALQIMGKRIRALEQGLPDPMKLPPPVIKRRDEPERERGGGGMSM